MKTFKVTFFEKTDIFSVITYHNVEDQSAMLEQIANNIVTLDLAPVVRMEADGIRYDNIANYLLKYKIARIDNNYVTNWYNNL